MEPLQATLAPKSEYEGPIINEREQESGAQDFDKFQRRISSLDRELRNIANACRQLGSSIGILSSSFQLRVRIAEVLFLFRENAIRLFPLGDFSQPKPDAIIRSDLPRRRSKRRAPPHVVRPVVSERLESEDFPYQLAEFARDITCFLETLNEFPEFTDEVLNNTISLLDRDLKCWASELKSYKGQLQSPAVQPYLHSLMSEMGNHLAAVTSSLTMYLEIGIPTIRFAQKSSASNLLNLTTVATFFSTVTATTLQFTFQLNKDSLDKEVNTFWFCSLVFSVASVVNGLLGLTWKQAMYRSPGHRVPSWMAIWIKRSPLIFLVASVASFSVGLCIFAFSSHQSSVTASLTVVFTAFSSFGLIAVSTWLTFERWIFSRYKGRKFLIDVLADIRGEIFAIPAKGWLALCPVMRHLQQAGRSLLCVAMQLSRVICVREKVRDNDGSKLPVHRRTGQILSASPISPTSCLPPVTAIPSCEATVPSSNTRGSLLAHDTGNIPDPPKLTAMMEFSGPVGSDMMLRTASPSLESVTMSESRSPSGVMRSLASHATSFDPSALDGLQMVQSFQPCRKAILQMQFSPNGRFLATLGHDAECTVLSTIDSYNVVQVLTHPQEFIEQVAWSTDGAVLLTKMEQGVKVWMTDSWTCRKTIDRGRVVQSIAWCTGGETFLSIEGRTVTKLNLDGEVLESHHFPFMELHRVTVVPTDASGCDRLLAAVTLPISGDGSQMGGPRVAKQIIVYNLNKQETESRVPILNDVSDIALARNGRDALVSYKSGNATQLWRIEMVTDRDNESNVYARLSLRHAYGVSSGALPSCFGGQDDDLVVHAGTEIQVQGREGGVILSRQCASYACVRLTYVASNPAVGPVMFAEGLSNGEIRIYTTAAAREWWMRHVYQQE